jgi:hypothetical protein
MNTVSTLSIAVASLTFVGMQLRSTLQAPTGLTEEQRAILSHLELVELEDGQGGTVPTIRISRVNLQLVNGLGATNGNPADPFSTDPMAATTNGAGNLILGYAEVLLGTSVDRTGSHNLVAGIGHGYASFGGAVIGLQNSIEAPYATVVGGTWNRGTGLAAAVAGGTNNLAGGPYSAVAGGSFDWATGNAAFVGGGSRSLASGALSSVTGGYKSTASGELTSVNGGDRCRASGPRSTISGGSQRAVDGFADWGAGSLFEDQ